MMNMQDLEEALSEILPIGFRLEKNRRGQVIIYTNLMMDEDGELIDYENDEEEIEIDHDFEPLSDKDGDDEE